jgi:hypothetical protein
MTRLRLPSPAMVVALIALAVALSGTAYAAVKIGPSNIMRGAVRSAHLKDEEVKINDVAPIARFRRATGLVSEQTVLRFGSLRLSYACFNDGVSIRTSLIARTTVDNAFADLGFVTGADGFGSSFYTLDADFDTGEAFDLDRNRLFGSGSFLYTTPAGAVVSVSYGFTSTSTCFAHGVVTGG